MPELKVLISREQIAERVAAIGAEITRDFAGRIRNLRGRTERRSHFLRRSRPASETRCHFRFHRSLQLRQSPQPRSGAEARMGLHRRSPAHQGHGQPIKDKNVILVEDILDTGLTLTYLKKMLSTRQPKSLRMAALLDKPSRRKMPIVG